MAIRTIIRTYATYDAAVETIYEVERSGVPDVAVSLIGSEADPRLPADVIGDAAQPPALIGATTGAVIGGGICTLIGVGAINTPWLGNFAADGWVATLLIGAVVGAVIGALVAMAFKVGVTNRNAHNVAEALHRGQFVVMVRVDEASVAATEAVLDRPRVVSTPSVATNNPETEGYDTLPPQSPAQEQAAIYQQEVRIERNSA